MSILSFEPDVLKRVVSQGHAEGSSEEGTIHTSTIVRGFQDVLSYMRVFVDLSRVLQQEPSEIVARRCDFRFRQLTRWRVNRHSGIDGPFKEVALFVNDELLGGAYSKSQIIADIDELLENWGFTHLRSMDAMF